MSVGKSATLKETATIFEKKTKHFAMQCCTLFRVYVTGPYHGFFLNFWLGLVVENPGAATQLKRMP